MRKICCAILWLWLGTSCLNTENRRARQQPVVFADYRIWGEEGKEDVTCLFRFFEGNPDGETVVFDEGSIAIDGVRLKQDSAGQSGAFFELRSPIQRFAGTHNIVYRDETGKEYRETFVYQPFSIDPELEPVQLRGPISIGITGLEERDQLRVIVTDTSFNTPDINELIPVLDGRITINPMQLNNVSSGPLNLHLFREEERPLKNPPPGGGVIAISYSLQRVFALADP